MTFAAGSVTGSLNFDLSEYTKSMIDAESLMQAFPAIVLECLENPMLAAIEVFKEAADAFRETIAEVGNEAQEIGLAAEKAGTSVQWFSEMANVAKSVNISTEQLSTGFKFLQRTASDAVTGMSAEASRAFGELGVSTDFLREHLSDTRGLFEAVQERIQALPSAAQRTQAAMEVLGRSGSDLVPLFEMSRQSMQHLIDEAHKLGAVEDEQSAAAGRAWGIIESEITEAWDGIKKALSEPILDYLAHHLDDVENVIEGVAGAIKSVIPLALDALKVAIRVAMPFIDMLLFGLEGVAEILDATGATSGLADNIEKAANAANNIVYDVPDNGPLVTQFNAEKKKGEQSKGSSGGIPAPALPFGDDSMIPSDGSGSGGGGFGGSGAQSGGGGWDGYSGILQVSIVSAGPSIWAGAADAFRPVLFEVANAIESANANASTTSASAGSSSTAGKSTITPTVEVQIESLNVAGLNASAIAESIARQITPKIKDAIGRQQQAAEAAARHSKVEAAVNGQGD